MQQVNQDLKSLKYSTVLIVDDDSKQLEYLQNTLTNFFGSVITAGNGQEGLEKYLTSDVHAVITDYVMPKMDGLKLCKEIRKINNDVPIVILSNYSEREKLLDIIPIKLTAYLLKPINLNILIETLQSIAIELFHKQQLVFKINEQLTYNFFTKRLLSTGVEIPLVKSEVLLLELLIKNKNTLVYNEAIEDALKNEKIPSYKSIVNIIYRLRKKIGKEHLLNVQSIGYILKPV
jgi:DNA-binding response OmpR family regulator